MPLIGNALNFNPVYDRKSGYQQSFDNANVLQQQRNRRDLVEQNALYNQQDQRQLAAENALSQRKFGETQRQNSMDMESAKHKYDVDAITRIGQLPEAQRSGAWDLYIQQGEKLFNVPADPRYKTYNPQVFQQTYNAFVTPEDPNAGYGKTPVDMKVDGVEGKYYTGPGKDPMLAGGLVENQRSAGQNEFGSLTEGLSDEDAKIARRIKLGLDPRAVGSSMQTITFKGIADEIAGSEAIIAEGKKFAEMQGSQRSQAIDKGYTKVIDLEQNINNLDNAIDAVKAGAGTGAITKRFPSIRGSSVLLDNVQGALALDVIGAVTFGALSKGELDLAKAIAIPTGLEGPELITWLTDKKAAQQKLLGYFKDQIEFLDQGGSVAGFLRAKKRGGRPQQPAQSQQQPQVIKFDAQGNIVQ